MLTHQWLCLVTLYVLVFQFQGLAQQQPVNSQDNKGRQGRKDNIGSIFEAPVLNAMSWENGDCLVKEKLVLNNLKTKEDGSKTGALVESHSYIRNAFDFADKKYSTHLFTKISILDFDRLDEQGEPSNQEIEYWLGGVADLSSGEIVINDSGQGYRKAMLPEPYKKRIEDVVELRFRDYRPCWTLDGFTESAFLNERKSVELRKSSKFESATQKGDMLTIKIKGSSNLASQGIKGPFIEYKFDLRTSTPVYYSIELKGPDGSPMLDNDVTLEWTKLDEIMLPSKMYHRGPFDDLRPSAKGKADGEREIKFHWFYINSNRKKNGQKPSPFDIDNLQSRNSIFSMVDPSITKATKLLSSQSNLDRNKDDLSK